MTNFLTFVEVVGLVILLILATPWFILLFGKLVEGWLSRYYDWVTSLFDK